ncbi:MAG: nadD [Firmicutes bacterium]|nr:nadD [Bacillota bacterium]
MVKWRKVGVMGGTFDPIHVAHLITAETVRMEYELDEVLFIPAGNPPHKQDVEVTPAFHRYIMTILATSSNPYFTVSDIEIERPGPSYAIDTLRTLRTHYGEETDFYFITGTDAARDLPTWENSTAVLDLCYFVEVSRPGCGSDYAEVLRRTFGDKASRRIYHLTAPELDISATDIRERIKKERSIRYLVPESVESYIYKNGLYR